MFQQGVAALESLAPWAAAGGSAGFGFWAVRWFIEWASGRLDKQRDQIDAGTSRLIERLEKRVDDLTARLDKAESQLAECREMHANAEAELKGLRAVVNAQGSMRQEAQVLIAAEKIAAKTRENGG